MHLCTRHKGSGANSGSWGHEFHSVGRRGEMKHELKHNMYSKLVFPVQILWQGSSTCCDKWATYVHMCVDTEFHAQCTLLQVCMTEVRLKQADMTDCVRESHMPGFDRYAMLLLHPFLAESSGICLKPKPAQCCGQPERILIDTLACTCDLL